MGEWWYNSVHS